MLSLLELQSHAAHRSEQLAREAEEYRAARLAAGAPSRSRVSSLRLLRQLLALRTWRPSRRARVALARR